MLVKYQVFHDESSMSAAEGSNDAEVFVYRAQEELLSHVMSSVSESIPASRQFPMTHLIIARS